MLWGWGRGTAHAQIWILTPYHVCARNLRIPCTALVSSEYHFSYLLEEFEVWKKNFNFSFRRLLSRRHILPWYSKINDIKSDFFKLGVVSQYTTKPALYIQRNSKKERAAYFSRRQRRSRFHLYSLLSLGLSAFSFWNWVSMCILLYSTSLEAASGFWYCQRLVEGWKGTLVTFSRVFFSGPWFQQQVSAFVHGHTFCLVVLPLLLQVLLGLDIIPSCSVPSGPGCLQGTSTAGSAALHVS